MSCWCIFFSGIILTYCNLLFKNSFSLLNIFSYLLSYGFTWRILNFIIADRSVSLTLIFISLFKLLRIAFFVLHFFKNILSYRFVYFYIFIAFTTSHYQIFLNLIITLTLTFIITFLLFQSTQSLLRWYGFTRWSTRSLFRLLLS